MLWCVLDYLRTIRDPEKPNTLEDLKVVYEEGIFVKEPTADKVPVLRVEYNPTVPHCSLATLIGLCIRIKILRSIHHPVKLDIFIKKGAHTTEDESKRWNFLNSENAIIRSKMHFTIFFCRKKIITILWSLNSNENKYLLQSI